MFVVGVYVLLISKTANIRKRSLTKEMRRSVFRMGNLSVQTSAFLTAQQISSFFLRLACDKNPRIDSSSG